MIYTDVLYIVVAILVIIDLGGDIIRKIIARKRFKKHLEIHHIKPIEAKKLYGIYNPKNLIAISREKHIALHKHKE